MAMVAEPGPLTGAQTQTLDAYWRTANYLSAGQIYLMANPLLAEPLRTEHIKPRLLGHWGTSPGLNFIWAHLSRAITAHGTEMMIVIGPGHGGPAALANTWLEGSYSEVYPSVPLNAAGMHTLFRQFSFPGGVPSHVAPETPGSIHEGGAIQDRARSGGSGERARWPLRAQIAAMTAALGGLDILVFTGGIGEHQAQTRAEAASGLGFQGVAVDEGRNATAQPDCDISAPGATARTLVITAREDIEIARQTRTVLAES